MFTLRVWAPSSDPSRPVNFRPDQHFDTKAELLAAIRRLYSGGSRINKIRITRLNQTYVIEAPKS